MNIKKLKLVGLIVVWMISISTSFNFIFASTVDEKNTVLVEGHYSRLQKVVVKGGVSYDLYIKENPNFYKIGADNSDCFSPGAFEEGVKEEQPIKMWLQKSWFRKPMIVRLVANNVNYLSFYCANENIGNERIFMPFMLLIIALLLSGLIYKNQIKLR